VAHAIFISYRRDDSEGEAGRLFDDLTRAFGGDAVFMDVSGIDPGTDFRKAIDDNVACCGVLLAMIGPTWATITGADGQRRLDNADDYVRLEIASALSRNIPVIPVLVHDARMPHADQLPDNLKDLAYRNSVEITHARWNSDVQLLIQALAQYVHSTKATEADTVHATVPVQLPAPHPATKAAPVRTQSKMPWIAGLVAIAVIVLAATVFFAMRGSGGESDNKAAANPLDGRWTNPSATGRGAIAALDISGTGTQLAIHAWSLCRPANCDLGTQNATFDGQKAKATWSLLNEAGDQETGRVATLTVSRTADKLNVLVENTYAQHAGNTHQFEFVGAQ
jgi:TIR domain